MTAGAFPTRRQIEDRQLARLRRLLCGLGANAFYAGRIRAAGLDRGVESLQAYAAAMPFTHKHELARDQEEHPPFGTNLTRPPAGYTRIHRTSSTTGAPLCWLDTPESWASMVEGWQEVLRAAGVAAGDRVLVAFSFGPFLGLWLAFEAAQALGCLSFPGGGMSSESRLEAMLGSRITVLCCTPTYALRLGEVARMTGVDLGRGGVRAIVVGGEPGASVPATRATIEALWPGATLFDHYGMTEAGPVTFQCGKAPDVVHALEADHICEVVDPETGLPAGEGRSGELVLTNLGRSDSPVLRYRTGDLVRPHRGGPCACGRHDLSFEGGILGRVDDMVIIRGVNLYPSAVDGLVRACGGIAEYRVDVRTERGMTELELKVEPAPGSDPEQLCALVARRFRDAHGLRVPVTAVPPDSLPRFELKARRWIRQ